MPPRHCALHKNKDILTPRHCSTETFYYTRHFDTQTFCNRSYTWVLADEALYYSTIYPNSRSPSSLAWVQCTQACFQPNPHIGWPSGLWCITVYCQRLLKINMFCWEYILSLIFFFYHFAAICSSTLVAFVSPCVKCQVTARSLAGHREMANRDVCSLIQKLYWLSRQNPFVLIPYQ